MPRMLVRGQVFDEWPFTSEAEIDDLVERFSAHLFGPDSFYCSVKKRTGSRVVAVPDGYLLDFARSRPQLVIVENETSSHDAFRHIGIQLLKYAGTFREGSARLKSLLIKHIHGDRKLESKIEARSRKAGFKNLSEMLDFVVYENSFRFLVVVDEATEDVNFVLGQLSNAPDILRIRRYGRGKEVIYELDGYREGIERKLSKGIRSLDDLDTIVCSAYEKGFKEVFLRENRWHAIPISSSMIPQLKYIAMYEKKPVGAIRWIGLIREIRPYRDSGKYEVVLTERKRIKPVPLGAGGQRDAPQAPRYTTRKLLHSARTLADLW